MNFLQRSDCLKASFYNGSDKPRQVTQAGKGGCLLMEENGQLFLRYYENKSLVSKAVTLVTDNSNTILDGALVLGNMGLVAVDFASGCANPNSGARCIAAKKAERHWNSVKENWESLTEDVKRNAAAPKRDGLVLRFQIVLTEATVLGVQRGEGVSKLVLRSWRMR